MAGNTILKNSKKTSPDEKPSLWKRVFRFLVWIVIIIPLFLVLVLFALSQFNPPFSFQMAKSFISHGNINHEWVDFENLPDDFGLTILATEDEHFCLHWGFDLKSSLDNEKGKPTTITQKAVRSLFLGDSEWALRRVLETPLTVLVEILWTKQRILELYLNYAGIDSSTFGVAAVSQTIFEKDIEILSLAESALLTLVLEAPNEIDPNNLPPELVFRAEWVENKVGELKAEGLGECLAKR